jgi:GDP-L-fucose synthase
MTNILVTGHKGLVGSAIKKKIIERDDENLNLYYADRTAVDLLNMDEVLLLFDKVHFHEVYHCAGLVGGVGANSEAGYDFLYENAVMGLNIVEACRLFNVESLLNFGSACIYPKNAPEPIKEESFLTGALERTNKGYSIAKIMVVEAVRQCCVQYDKEWATIMPTNLYGAENDNFNVETAHVIPAIIKKMYLAKAYMAGRFDEFRSMMCQDIEWAQNADNEFLARHIGITPTSLSLWGSGNARRDFLYVDDLADLALLAMADLKDMNYIFNAGSGTEFAIKDIAELIRNTVGYEGEIKWMGAGYNEGVRSRILDDEMIGGMDWWPKISMAEGIGLAYEGFLRKYQIK